MLCISLEFFVILSHELESISIRYDMLGLLIAPVMRVTPSYIVLGRGTILKHFSGIFCDCDLLILISIPTLVRKHYVVLDKLVLHLDHGEYTTFHHRSGVQKSL